MMFSWPEWQPLPPTPSRRLFYPLKGRLRPYGPTAPERVLRAHWASEEIRSLLAQPHYPCVAALQSYHQDDYQVGFYEQLGTGRSWRDLRRDLQFFISEQKRSKSTTLTFWAIFPDAELTEEQFETAFWKELSYLTSVEDRAQDWKSMDNADPQSPAFRLSLEGTEFFVVGLHSQSSRRARRFGAPAMVFNVFEQFEDLEERGLYEPMVKINRQRDQKFQGQANPMVTQHGDAWESIQFSGRENGPEWKCPFSFLFRREKP